MRPSPREVRARLSGELTADMLVTHLTTLQRDPNWQVLDHAGTSIRILQLVHAPTGETVEVALMRSGDVWRVRR